MTSLAPLLESFFLERLCKQRQASPNTIASYRDCFRLLLSFAQKRLGKAPSDLLLSELDPALIGAFLQHLEEERGNSSRTRNARLAAIRSFFKYVAPLEPAHSGQIQRVLAIPIKRCAKNIVCYLTRTEVKALLAAPDRTASLGRRDHVMLFVMVQTGLRVSELTGLTVEQLVLKKGPGSHIRCRGKGRKERVTPLTTEAVRLIRTWLQETGARASDPVFPSRRGGALSRDAVERLVAKHSRTAAERCKSLATKRVSPHTLRHTTAVQLLQAGVSLPTIALWLGHEKLETTNIYLHADLTIKEKALAKVAPLAAKARRYQPLDPLLAFLLAI